jgi:hypothetical protein
VAGSTRDSVKMWFAAVRGKVSRTERPVSLCVDRNVYCAARALHPPGYFGSKMRVRFGCRLLARVVTIGPAAVTTLPLDLTARAWVQPVWAQEAQHVSITVAPLTLAAPSSKTQLPIQATPSPLEYGLCL